MLRGGSVHSLQAGPSWRWRMLGERRRAGSGLLGRFGAARRRALHRLAAGLWGGFTRGSPFVGQGLEVGASRRGRAPAGWGIWRLVLPPPSPCSFERRSGVPAFFPVGLFAGRLTPHPPSPLFFGLQGARVGWLWWSGAGTGAIAWGLGSVAWLGSGLGAWGRQRPFCGAFGAAVSVGVAAIFFASLPSQS